MSPDVSNASSAIESREFTPVQVLRQLNKILADPLFAKAERLSAFLRYTVETTLAGKTDHLKEFVIGAEVFGKGPSFDPQTDNFVRVSANRLRGKLAEYYHRSGRFDSIVIDVPKGRYIATFAVAPASHRSDAAPAVATHGRYSVGRERERSRIAAAFATACSGRGTMLGISGDPGLGKTTLMEEFLADLGPETAWIASGRSSERPESADAFAPIFECLEGLTRSEQGAEAERLLKVSAPSWHSLVAPLSHVEVGSSPKQVSPDRMRREFLRFFEALCRVRPVIVFLDDLHWADASTCDLLAYAGSHMKVLRMLIVVTYRPSELTRRHPFLPVRLTLERNGVCHEIVLEPLTLRDIESYLTIRFPSHGFPSDFANTVLERTEGSPLFLTDMIGFLLDQRILADESGQWRLSRSVAEIQNVIPTGSANMIRLQMNQLAAQDRKILQCAAVQGVEFDSEVISRALTVDPIDVEERLQKLQRVHRFVRCVGEKIFSAQAYSVRYRFAHVYYQNALYAELAPARRASYSLAVAEALVGLNGDAGRSLPAEVAPLFECGRAPARASEYFLRAARIAAGVFAYPEAVLLCERGIAILRWVPESRERDARELKFSLILGLAQMATCGFAAPEVEKTHRRSRDLCQRLGEKRHLVRVLWAIHTCVVNAGDLVQALDIARQMKQVASELSDPVSTIESLHALGTTHAFMGNLTQARELLERIFTILPADQHRLSPSLYVLDTRVTSLSMLARVLAGLGFVEEAKARALASLSLANHLAHPPSVTYATLWVGWICHARGEYEDACGCLEAAMSLGREHGLPQIVEWGRVIRGSCLAHTGRVAEGIAEIRTSLENQDAMRCLLDRPYCLTLLAEALVLSDNLSEAIALCDEAIRIANETLGGSHTPATLRIRAEIAQLQTNRQP